MLKQFFHDKSWAQRLMLGAVALNFLSQFLLYSDVYQSFTVSTDGFGVLNFMWADNLGRHSGWEMHWHAGPILVLLAFCYARDDVVDGGMFSRFGWWTTALLIFAVMIPFDWDFSGFGAFWGFISLVIAIVATVMHARDRKRMKAAGIAPAAAPK